MLRGRGHHAERYEYLDDPVHQDLESVDLQVHIIGSVERGEWRRRHADAVLVVLGGAGACHTHPERARWHGGGHASLAAVPGQGQRAREVHGGSLCAAAAKAGKMFMVENPPSAVAGACAYWASKADHATLWDQPCMRRLVQDVPTSKVTFAQCAFGSPFQKLTTILASGHAAPALALLRRTCTHTTHAERHPPGRRATRPRSTWRLPT